MASNQIRCTKDYRIFHRHSDENRPLNLKWHKRLVESMKEYGFIRAYPIICFRDKDKRLIIKDGQHRAVIAEMLGLRRSCCRRRGQGATCPVCASSLPAATVTV